MPTSGNRFETVASGFKAERSLRERFLAPGVAKGDRAAPASGALELETPHRMSPPMTGSGTNGPRGVNGGHRAALALGAHDGVLLVGWFMGTCLLFLGGVGPAPGFLWQVIAGLVVLSAVVIAFDALIDIRRVFRCRNIVLVFVFYTVLLDVVQKKYAVTGVENSTYMYGAAVYSMFVTAWLMSYSVVRGSPWFARFVSRHVRPISPRVVFVAILVIFVGETVRRLVLVNWDLSTLVDQTLLARSGPVAFGRERFGDSRVFLEPLGWLFDYIPILVAFAWDSVKGPARRLLLLTCAGTVVATLFFGGTRAALAAPLITALGYRLLVVKARNRVKVALIMVGVACLLAPAMDLMLRFRDVGWQAAFEVPAPLRGLTLDPLEAQRDSNFSEMAGMMQVVKEIGGRPAWELYYYLLISPVPRVLWPDKPYMSQEYLGDYRKEYASMSSVGDMYLYGGVLHVLVGGLLFGLVVRSLDRLFQIAFARREWVFAYCLLMWLAVTSLRALWNVVVQVEVLTAVFVVIAMMGRFSSSWVRKRMLDATLRAGRGLVGRG
jgi:hypothetical protein